jgi:hypothetical protein
MGNRFHRREKVGLGASSDLILFTDMTMFSKKMFVALFAIQPWLRQS